MAHAYPDMPYFINPSLAFNDEKKHLAYQQANADLDALLQDETDVILKMVSINCILKTHLPYYYWVGFYCVNEGKLIVGPYQGTLGCLHIEFKKGVCGAVANTKQTMIVPDVHALSQGDEHIACDPNSQSEIVVPVLNQQKELIAVFDVDSSMTNSFNDIDKQYLESIMNRHFSSSPLSQTCLV